MPNSAQIELLESFIGEDGIYYETIRDCDGFDLKTKCRALDKIMTSEGATFLDSLGGAHKPHVEEFIRALKVINDLFFNNSVIYGEYGSRSALTHYFGALGPVDVKDFKQVISNMLYKRREMLHACSALEGILTVKEIHDLPKNIRMIIVPFSNYFARLVNEIHAPVADLLALEPDLLDLLVRNTSEIKGLISHAHISFEDLIALKPGLRTTVIKYPWGNIVPLIVDAHVSLAEVNELEESLSDLIAFNARGVAALITGAHVTFTDLIALEPTIRTMVINHAGGISSLITHLHISFAELLAMEPELRTLIINNAGAFFRLVRDAHIPFTELLALEPELRTLVSNHALDIIALAERGLPLATLLALEPELRTEILNNTNGTFYLLSSGVSLADLLALEPSLRTIVIYRSNRSLGIPFAKLIALEPALRAMIINNLSGIISLFASDDAHVRFMDLIAVEPALRTLIINNISGVVAIIRKEHIPFERLSTLTPLQLQAILDDSTSEEAQAILHPSSGPAASR